MINLDPRRHAPGSIKVHLKYGRLSLRDVQSAVDSLDRKGKCPDWKTMTTKELRKAKHEVEKELATRGHKRK